MSFRISYNISGDAILNSKKQLIRRELLKRRNSLNEDDVSSFSQLIIGKILRMQEFFESNVIMTYINFDNEVITTDLINKCFLMGKKVTVPAIVNIDDKKTKMVTSQIYDWNCMVKGKYGILQPDYRFLHIIEPKEIDFILIPGIAFDKKKNRLGFGKGYFDRFLIQTRKNCYKVGLAYDFQVIDELPVESHDIPLDFIVTEKRIF